MKKFIPFIVAALVLVGGLGAYLALKKDNKPVTNNTAAGTEASATDNSFEVVKACDALTLELAKKVLGDSVEAAATNSDAPSESDELVVTNCNYSITGAALGDNKTASLLVRSPRTKAGADSNKDAFGSLKPASAQNVSGYGEAAFWNPDFGQFNVLKDNSWYIVSNGSLRPTERSIEDAKALADTLGLADGL